MLSLAKVTIFRIWTRIGNSSGGVLSPYLFTRLIEWSDVYLSTAIAYYCAMFALSVWCGAVMQCLFRACKGPWYGDDIQFSRTEIWSSWATTSLTKTRLWRSTCKRGQDLTVRPSRSSLQVTLYTATLWLTKLWRHRHPRLPVRLCEMKLYTASQKPHQHLIYIFIHHKW